MLTISPFQSTQPSAMTSIHLPTHPSTYYRPILPPIHSCCLSTYIFIWFLPLLSLCICLLTTLNLCSEPNLYTIYMRCYVFLFRCSEIQCSCHLYLYSSVSRINHVATTSIQQQNTCNVICFLEKREYGDGELKGLFTNDAQWTTFVVCAFHIFSHSKQLTCAASILIMRVSKCSSVTLTFVPEQMRQ
jgi:hypothetical protein